MRDRLPELAGAGGAERVAARGRRWPAIAAVAASVLLAAGIALWQLRERDYFWSNPLAGARFTRFTDWEGSETDAFISSDGKFVAFASDRAGQFDAWVGQVGGGEFLNLTKGMFQEWGVGVARSVGFTREGAHVWFRVQSKLTSAFEVWLVPTIGGPPRPFLLPEAVEAAWSPDGSQVAYFFTPSTRSSSPTRTAAARSRSWPTSRASTTTI